MPGKRLRNRLNRRGVTASTAIGPVSAWLAGKRVASSATVATAALSSTTIPGELPAAIARIVSRIAAGQTPAAVSLSVTSLALARGVLKTMMLKKLTVAVCALLPLGIIVLGGGASSFRDPGRRTTHHPRPPWVKVRGQPPQRTRRIPRKSTPWSSNCSKPRKLLEGRRHDFEIEGRTRIDRYVDACQKLGMVELKTARSDAERLAIRQRHVDRLKEFEKVEKTLLSEVSCRKATWRT